jgi:hypothetical protein
MAETLPCIGNGKRKLKPFRDFPAFSKDSIMAKTSNKSRQSDVATMVATEVEVSTVVADVTAQTGADAAADVVADMVAGLGDALAEGDAVLVAPRGWSEIEAGLEVVETDWNSIDLASDYERPVAPVAPVAGDLVMQVFGAMPAAALTMFAQAFADKHTAIVTLRDAVTFEVQAIITPGMGKPARRVSGGTRSGSVAGVARASVDRAETIIDRIKRGVWLDSEVSLTNLTILNLKHKIEAAAAAGDVDMLKSLGGFKSTSTYYNHARAYLDFHIVDAPIRAAEREAIRVAEQAALDREFGFAELVAA